MSLLRCSCQKTLYAIVKVTPHVFDSRSSALLSLLQPATSAQSLLNVHGHLSAAYTSSMDQPRDNQPKTEPQQQQQQPECQACDGCDGAPELTPGLVPERGDAAPANPDCYACHDDKLPTAPPPGYSADTS
jgi:hypothetical protein